MIALLFVLAISMAHRIESVDLIELNHYHDARGKLVFDQVVFWAIDQTTREFCVRAWCMVDDREELNRVPIKSEINGRWSVVWRDSDKRVVRHITSQQYRESWSQLDPEREDKKRHDERLRIALVSPIPEVTNEQ